MNNNKQYYAISNPDGKIIRQEIAGKDIFLLTVNEADAERLAKRLGLQFKAVSRSFVRQSVRCGLTAAVSGYDADGTRFAYFIEPQAG